METDSTVVAWLTFLWFRNSSHMTVEEYLTSLLHWKPVCVSVFLCISTRHFVCLNRCICLLAVGAHCALFLQSLGGALALALQLHVNQAALQTASQAPHRVGSCSSLVSPCHPKFLSSPPLLLLQSFNHRHQLFSEKHFSLTISFKSQICCTVLWWVVIKWYEIKQRCGLSKKS